MTPSNVFMTTLQVLTVIVILQSQTSKSIPPEQVQKICACTNATKDTCTTIITSNPTFISAPDAKALVPLVATNISHSVEKVLDYAKSLAAKTGDPKLKRLYEGCATLYSNTNVIIHVAIDAAKAGDLKKASEHVDEAEFEVHDCSIGPKELDVNDPSDLGSYNKEAKALLDILTCVIQFAT